MQTTLESLLATGADDAPAISAPGRNPLNYAELRALLRGTAPDGQPWSDAQIAAAVGLVWGEREDRYSALRSASQAAEHSTSGPGNSADSARRVEMHYIGG